MQKEYYDVYLYRYSELHGYAEIESMITKSGLIDGISIMDISDREDDEAGAIIGDVIKAEKVREYDGLDDIAIVHLFLDRQNKFTLVLSIYESDKTAHCIKRIVEAFKLPMAQMQPISLYGYAKGNPYDSVNYWQSTIPDFFKYPMKECNESSENYRQVERYYVDDDLKQLLLATMESNPNGIKTVMMNAFGWIVASNLKQKTIIMEDIHEGGVLDRVPLLYDHTLSWNDQNDQMDKQLSLAERYDMCTSEKLDILSEKKISLYTLVGFELTNDGKYGTFLQKSKDFTLYHFCKRVEITSPIAVYAHVGADGISLTYDFDYAAFENLSIEDLHNVLCKVIKARLLNEEIDERNLTSSKPSSMPAKIRIRDVKAKLLKNLPIFAGYSESELLELSDKFEVIHKDSRQEALSQNYRCEKLLFIISGRIEVDGLDSKRFLRPLLMLKAGDVFGIDSLLGNKKSALLYQVFSDEAVMLSIDADKFATESEKHPELMTALLEVQTERMYKFAKLWMKA